MFNKIIIVLIFVSSNLYFSQKTEFVSDLQIYYDMTFKSDSTQNNTVNSTVCLYVRDKESIFQDAQKYKIDSIISKDKITIIPSIPMFRVNHVIFKDLLKKQIVYSEIIDKVNFGFKEKINDFHWELLNGNKKILNYNCSSAKINLHGRDYIAWYTNEIPISDGPYKFAGLPGLILEIFDEKENFHYTALAIEKKSVNIYYSSNIKEIERITLRDAKINNIMKISEGTARLNPMELK